MTDLDNKLRAALSKLPAEDRKHNNTQLFFKTNAKNWLWVLVQHHLWDGTLLDAFAEEEHNDGGASGLHLSLTDVGPRSLECRTSQGTVEHRSDAGSIYFGGMVGCRHQVWHPHKDVADSLAFPGLGPVFSAVQFRCNIFNYDKARGKTHPPTPSTTFDAFMAIVKTWQLDHPFRMPSLSECLRAAQELTDTQSA